MATALDIIKSALGKLNIVAKGQDPDATDAADALKMLNRVLLDYEARGCSPVHAEMALATEWAAGDEFLLAIEDVLAKRLCKPFGITADPEILSDAYSADRRIIKAFRNSGTFGVDTPLQPIRMSGADFTW